MPPSTAWLLLPLACLVVPAQAETDPFDFDLTRETGPAAQRWQLSGFVEARSRRFTATGDWLSNRLLAQADLKWTEGRWRAFVQGTAEIDASKGEYRDRERYELREAYLHRDGDSLDITVGKQRVAWGTADGVSTIDRVNSIDFRDPISNARTPSRRPSWLVRVEQSTTVGIFEAVWLPRGRDRKFPEFGSPWETAALHDLRRLRAEGLIALTLDDPHRHEGGLRYRHYGRQLDWGLAVFDGFTDVPATILRKGNAIRLEPERIRTWNANAAVGFAKSTLRAELAYTPNHPVDGDSTSHWQAVLGWDRTFFTNLYTNVQVFWDRASSDEDSRGITFAVTNRVCDDAATVGLRGQLANDSQTAVEALIEYQWNDAVTLSARFLLFDGSPGSPLGEFRHNDFAELALRWSL